MKRLLLLAIFCLVAVLVAPAFAERPAVPADGIKLNHNGNPEKVVVFNHSTHKEDCADCHHPVDGKENYGKCASEGCHSLNKDDKLPYISLKGVIHNKKPSQFHTCLSCHTDQFGKDKDKKKDMTSCNGSKCHPS